MKMSGAEEAAAAAPAGGVARACAWSGAGGGGGGAGGGAAAAVDVVDDDAGRFATAARARSHHLLRCLRTLTAAQILRARCFSRSLCARRCRRAACAAVSGLLSPPACRSAAPREPLASVAGLPAAGWALAPHWPPQGFFVTTCFKNKLQNHETNIKIAKASSPNHDSNLHVNDQKITKKRLQNLIRLIGKTFA